MKSAAIIGCGRPPESFQNHKVGWGIAYAHADGYREAFPDVELSAVDPNPENLAAFAGKYNIPPARQFASTEALYAATTPDAVSVCTWPALHVSQAVDAVRRGVRAVTVEKPLGLDVMQVRDLEEAVRGAGGKSRVAVAHQRRYEAAYERARDLLRSGAIGTKLVLEARVGEDWDVLSWTVHWFDMANFFFGGPPKSILAGVDHHGDRRYGHAVERGSVVFADYGGDRQATFITGPAALPTFGVTVRGDAGMMVVGDSIKLWTTRGYEEVKPPAAPFGNAFAALFTDLWQSTRGGPASRCDLSQCAAATEMAYAAHESARTDRRVALPLETWFAPLEVMQNPARPAAAPGPKKIALIADGHHEWPTASMSGREGLVDALRALGHDVTLLDARQPLPAGALDGADVLALYHTQQKAEASHKAAIGQWLARGKPVLVSHCGIGAYADWPEFRAAIGRYWVWGGEPELTSMHPHVPVTIRVDDADGFDVPWSGAYLPTDEQYRRLGGSAEVCPLATAIAPDGGEQLYAWQVTAHPNVVVWLPGHRRDMFTLDAIRDGLAASLRLACAAGRRG